MVFQSFSLDSHNYLVTGAASGIGRATCILLSAMGAKLMMVDINEEGLAKTKNLCKSTDKILAFDLRDTTNLKKAILSEIPDFGKLNGVIHIAGKAYISPLKSISREKCDDIYSLNTYPALELSKIFISKDVYAGRNGSIVFISSIYALVGSAANVGYAMSKAALHGITKSLAIELAPKKIRVNCIAPGFIDTNMGVDINDKFENQHLDILRNLHPLGMGEPEDVANMLAYLLTDAAKWITGAILSVDGGFTAQ